MIENAIIQLEQALLGSLLSQPARIPIAASELHGSDFMESLHGRIFDTLVSWPSDERSISPVTVNAAMRGDSGLAELGGHSYLASLFFAAPAISNVAHMASGVREDALRRAALNACQDAAQALQETSHPVATILRDIMVVADQATAVKARPVALPDALRSVLDRAERSLRGDRDPAVTTGLRLLDEALAGGLLGGDLMIVPGRPGAGKSTLLSAIGMRAAMAGHPVLVFSLEMLTNQWLERCLADLDFDAYPGSPLAYQQFRAGTLDASEIERAAVAGRRLHDIPMEISDSGDLTVEDIAARARAFKAKHKDKLGLIVVDYLQKVAPSGGRDRNREQEVAHVAAGLKRLAKAIGWPVAAGAQLLTKGGDPRAANKEIIPSLAAIRESGSIEAEADIIAAPHRKAWFIGKERPDAPDDSPEMEKWRGEYRAVKNQMKLYGLKFRHGAEFVLDLYVNMASSSVRDERPYVSSAEVEKAQRDLAL